MASRIIIAATLMFASASVAAEITGGEYLFLFGSLVECEERIQLLDFAIVSESGEARFFNKFDLAVLGMDGERVASTLADTIAGRTGRRPSTLSIRVVASDDSRTLMRLLDELISSKVSCEVPGQPPIPFEPGQRIATASPPNKALQPTLDPAVLFAVAKSPSASSAAELGR